MSEGDDGQGGSRQVEEPMQQDASQAGGEDDRASTGGVSSLDFNIFSDLENNADNWRRLNQRMKAFRHWSLRQPLQK